MAKVNVEQVKTESHGLFSPLAQDLTTSDAFLSEAGKILIKFHGSYEQTNRDKRGGAAKEFSFMVRSKLPGGRLTADQYLAHDRIADEFANGSLRLTTRQGIQFHGVIKDDLRGTVRALNHALVTTFGACGDVVRNVMCCPAPTADPQRLAVQALATDLSNATLPATKAYHQIWIEGKSIIDDEVEPDALYGKTYLPRKFKMAIAFPGDNCVDIYTQDLGLVALFDNANQLIGFNVLAGGGMGMTHNDEDTFPRLADVVGFVEPDAALAVTHAVVGIHRDFGDRNNRKHARLKYVIHDRGLAWFKEELQRRLPFELQAAHPMPEFTLPDHLGWHEQHDAAGNWYLGIPIASGRIIDTEQMQLRTALRLIVSEFNTPVHITGQQNVLLADIAPQHRERIEQILQTHHVLTVDQLSQVRRFALACVALPTCPLAITEAERAMPDLLDTFEDALEELGLLGEPINVRMTGCPNGCARPYTAEVAFVGRSLNKYTIFLGGSPASTRMAQVYQDLVPFSELVSRLKEPLTRFRDERQPNEAFGDFCHRAILTPVVSSQ
ncbi:MAG: NADPH-dependent assimilatory sulfite reductase hemoprotein subunit [Anaerolineae bacterium]|nr:NADPH-dependent assimilatory sulfite reductase hemoprotein subunit [Anaerolineae bacterium]